MLLSKYRWHTVGSKHNIVHRILQLQKVFDKNIRTSLLSDRDLHNQLLTKLGWSSRRHIFVATYSRCWLGSLECLNNVVHALGNCNILFWICFYIIKSIVNRRFLDFVSSMPWRICCVNFSLMCRFTKVRQVLHPLQKQQALRQEVLERICFLPLSTACSFLKSV